MTEAEYYAQWDPATKEGRKKLSQMWRTPKPLFDNLSRQAGGFTLDAYADEYNHLCDDYNTAAEPDRHQWAGHRVFANPPFGIAGQVAERGYRECIDNGTESWIILPASVNSIWWHEYARHGLVIFPRGRWRFDPPPGTQQSSPAADAMLVIYKPKNLSRCPRVLTCDARGNIDWGDPR